MTLQAIYDYANKLLDASLNDISDIIEYLNEAQRYIVGLDPLQASATGVLDETHSITLPSDFLALKAIVIDDYDYSTSGELWAGVITLPVGYTEGTYVLKYYRSPVLLDGNVTDQVPDIHEKYHPLLAVYAAKMYNLVEDDQEIKAAYMDEFVQGVSNLKTTDGANQRFFNY
jgi:hypothetical protein